MNYLPEYLVDTSIWVDFFRGKSPAIKDRIFELIASERIYCNGMVIYELLRGAKSKKEYNFIIDNFPGFKYLEMDRDFFVYSAQVAKQLSSSGKSFPNADIMIASHAKQHNLVLFTKDKHFETIGLELGIQFDIIENV